MPAGADPEALGVFFNIILENLSHHARDGAPRAKLGSIVDNAMAAWDAFTGAT